MFLSIMDLCISHATLPTRKSLPWLTKTLVNAMKKRNYYFRESKQSGDLHAFAKYKTLRNYIVMAPHEAKQAFFANLQPTNKHFWGTLKQISTNKTTITTLTSSNNALAATTNAEKANCLNEYFSSCFNTVLPQLSQSEFLYLDPDKCPSHCAMSLRYRICLLELMSPSPPVLTTSLVV